MKEVTQIINTAYKASDFESELKRNDMILSGV